MNEKFSLNDIAKEIAAKNGITKAEALAFVNNIFATIHEGLDNDAHVKVKGLGTFKVTSVQARESVSVNTGQRVIIEGHEKLSFTPDSTLRDLVNKPFAQFETVPLKDNVSFDDMPNDGAVQLKEEPVTEPVAEDIAPEKNALVGEETKDVTENTVAETQDNVITSSEDSCPSAEDITPETKETASVAEGENVKPILPSTLTSTEENKEEQKASAIIVPLAEMQVNEEPIEEKAIEEPLEVNPEETEDKNMPEEEAINSNDDVTNTEDENSLSAVVEEEYVEDEEEEEDGHTRRNILIAILLLLAVVAAGLFLYSQGYLSFMEKESPKTEIQKPIVADTSSVASTPTDSIAKASNTDNPSNKAEEPTIGQPSGKYKGMKYYEEHFPVVRGGAYRIMGIAKEVIAREGETLEKISNRHLGPGAVDYVEAINEKKTIVAGDTVLIPVIEEKPELYEILHGKKKK